jgi:hypothetical protein
MTYITSAYKRGSYDNQENRGEAVDILDLAVIPGLPDEHPDHFKWAVITLWQWGRLQSFEAIYWLQIGQHISAYEKYDDPDVYMRAYVHRERVRAESGRAA